ncbi:MAG: protein-glutamate O-methyltransferase CheR [Acidobacteria bacterium]|nr:protein-glutamate O-methyltransferase CheR [Acidobacteriota bacterium]
MGTLRTLPSPARPEEKPAVLSPENYAFLQQYIHRESGISIGSDKLYLLRSRLQPLVDQERLGSLDALCCRLRQTPPEALRRKVVESMTTHETLFFRDPSVFDMLRNDLLPELLREKKATRTLRIWCAACSSGQEPYSVAMMLLELGCADWDLQIHATDLSSQILERAQAGRYFQIEVNRGLPALMLVKYFERAGLDWQIKEPLRRMVRFSSFDLRQSMQARGPFDLVFCRNVLIYFEMDTRKQILAGIRGSLVAGGYLLLGSSETTFNLDDRFQRRTLRNSIVYQKPLAGATP